MITMLDMLGPKLHSPCPAKAPGLSLRILMAANPLQKGRRASSSQIFSSTKVQPP